MMNYTEGAAPNLQEAHVLKADVLCHSCGQPCFLGHVVLGGTEAEICTLCALKQPPAEQQGAVLACHRRLPEFQRWAHQLWWEGGGSGWEGVDVGAILKTEFKVTGSVRPRASLPPNQLLAACSLFGGNGCPREGKLSMISGPLLSYICATHFV